MSQQEMIYFDNGDVRVSSVSLLIRSKGSSYPIIHLSEATIGEFAPQNRTMNTLVLLCGIMLSISGLCSLVGLLAGENALVLAILSALLFAPGVALVVYGARHWPKASYVALVKGTFGEVYAATSPNRLYV